MDRKSKTRENSEMTRAHTHTASLVSDADTPERRVQSLLKVAIHGSGGATRLDLGMAVQFEGHWIARPNPGRQRAGGAAGAGSE